MNLFQVYEAAFEDMSSDMVIDADYIIDYVDGAFDSYIPKALAQKIVDAHNDWLNSERGSNNYYHLVQAKLEEYEIIVE